MILEAIQKWRHPLVGGESNDDVGEGVKKVVIVLLYHLFSTGDEKVDLFLQKKTQKCQHFIYCILN